MVLNAAQTSDLFWDSCVFLAFLWDERNAYDVNSIEQYLADARDGKCKIYTSSLVFAEVLPSSLKKPGFGAFQEFIDAFQGAITIIDASPNVMQIAGHLRDLPYQKNNSRGRRLATPDAIMLASCIYLDEAMGVRASAFHTFDNGRRRGPDGRSVPILSYQEWCEGFTREQMRMANRVINLNRCRPVHPVPPLPLPRS